MEKIFTSCFRISLPSSFLMMFRGGRDQFGVVLFFSFLLVFGLKDTRGVLFSVFLF